MGASNVEQRLLASLGKGGPVDAHFEPAADVPAAGVLCALPALLACGLLRHSAAHWRLPRGYYSLPSLLMLLAFMALARVRSVEKLRYCAPGEWGNVLGLDRIPEVRTLREKIALLSANSAAVRSWESVLAKQWMLEDPDSAGTLYVDGHVRVYHGKLAELPRRYVARQRLCLRGTTDYWVNGLGGQPFFVVTKEIDPGLLQVLEHDIVPRLESDLPPVHGDDTQRFLLVFDRAGYSAASFARMWRKKVACLSYHKFPGEDWPVEHFTSTAVVLPAGERVDWELCERGSWLAVSDPEPGQPRGIWLREIRKLTSDGHQVSILSSDRLTPAPRLAALMFARWAQENFFRYMMEHFSLDRMIEHGTEPIPETTRLTNPARRNLDSQIRSKTAVLSRRLAEFGALSYDGTIAPAQIERFEQKKALLQEQISGLKEQVTALKGRRADLPTHVVYKDLPQDQRFERLRSDSKHFIDTIKMIAYRAETAMANVLRDVLARTDDAREMLCALYKNDADLVPDDQAYTLTVRLHHLANRMSTTALQHLCDQLTATETVFPGTNLRLIYTLVSSQSPRDQEV
ncbi:MAG: putative transposase [Terriglobales bacterium]